MKRLSNNHKNYDLLPVPSVYMSAFYLLHTFIVLRIFYKVLKMPSGKPLLTLLAWKYWIIYKTKTVFR